MCLIVGKHNPGWFGAIPESEAAHAKDRPPRTLAGEYGSSLHLHPRGSPLRIINEDGKPGHKQFYFVEADEEHQVWLCWRSGFIPRKHRIQVLTTPRVEEAKDEEERAHIIIKTPDGDMTLEAPKDKELFELWTRKLTELVEDQAALQAGARASEKLEAGGAGKSAAIA
ncbi:hypothetical protein KFL_003150030 [Klebsormidium nitens]|uniref:PH domain-containing protein n=1 Tax=Klebsormidium nitens TaxID=105231 RepID=A0A1Y1IFG0_KLENI|nr:hypothetical protein KFL_003150030 [Klebsormidium nitens]|eukprot:GAQ86838.1 hypothetical protein KFL_003150030 [Klebsormidium nitens]